MASLEINLNDGTVVELQDTLDGKLSDEIFDIVALGVFKSISTGNYNIPKLKESRYEYDSRYLNWLELNINDIKCPANCTFTTHTDAQQSIKPNFIGWLKKHPNYKAPNTQTAAGLKVMYKKTNEVVFIGKQKRCIYVGKRGAEYIKDKGLFKRYKSSAH